MGLKCASVIAPVFSIYLYMYAYIYIYVLHQEVSELINP